MLEEDFIKAHDLFLRTYKEIEITIPYTHDWDNGTGYLDYAVKAKLETENKAKTEDEFGRKIILIPTELGNIVVFERYAPSHGPRILVANAHDLIRKVAGLDGALTEEKLARLFRA